MLAATLVGAPLLSLVLTALAGDTDTLLRLARTVLPAALADTAALLGGVAVLTGTMGCITAWLVTAYRFPGSRALAWLLPLPLAVPTYVTALVYVEILDAAGPVRSALREHAGRELADGLFPEIRSLPGCIVLISLVLYPYVFIAARAAFLARDPALTAAARTLGCGPLALLGRVSLALARPAIAVGLTLVLLETLNDIGASEYLGVRTLTVSAYTAWLNRGDLSGAAQIACVALGAVALLVAAERAQRSRGRPHGLPGTSRPPEPAVLTGWAGFGAALLCLLPPLLGFGVPAGFLAGAVLRQNLLASAGPAFADALGATIALAGAATILTLALGLALAVSDRIAPSPAKTQLGLLSNLGYAVPGTILVIGLLGPLIAVDGVLSGLARRLGADTSGLLLMSSGAAIVVAYVIRFLRVASDTLGAQFALHAPEVEQVARVLGAGPRALAWHIQLPLLRPAIGGAALLVFVDCLKELPATLLLRPAGIETLSTLVYGAASRGSFEDGALAALAIVLAGLGPIVWLTRTMQTGPLRRGRPDPRAQAAF